MTMLAPPTATPPTNPTRSKWWRLPAPPLRSRALRAAGLGGVTTAALALAVQSWLDAAPVQPLLACAVFAAIMGGALGTIRDHHPHPIFGPANYITMLRALLAALAASLLTEPAGAAVAWVLVMAAATIAVLDGVDGWLARRTQLSSPFGARFDMETDAFSMLVFSVLVWHHEKAGLWVIAIGLMRYAFVAAGWVLPWLAGPLRSTWRGKAVAIAQVVGLGIALLPIVPVRVSTLACAAALALLVWSFAIDVGYLWRHRAATAAT